MRIRCRYHSGWQLLKNGKCMLGNLIIALVLACTLSLQAGETQLIEEIFKGKWELNELQSEAAMDKLRLAKQRPDYDEMLTRLFHETANLNPAPFDPTLWTDSFDALIAAPNNHQVLAENSRVRILYVTFEPGDMPNYHTHKWAGIMVHLIPSDFIIYYPDKPEFFLSATADPVFTHPEGQPLHTAKNVGNVYYQGLHFEIKD